jgi:hypothetical protein
MTAIGVSDVGVIIEVSISYIRVRLWFNSPKTMSLPPATRDISDKPAAGAVTDPVNKQAKDADVDRKVRLVPFGFIHF